MKTIPFFLVAVKASLALMKKVRYAAFSAMMDFVFFFCLGFFASPFLRKIEQSLVHIGALLSPELVEKGSLTAALASEAVLPLIWKLAGLLAVLGFSLYVVYCAVQQPVWWFAGRISGRKISWKKHFLKFAAVNLLWFFLFFAYYFASVFAELRKTVIEKLMQVQVSAAINTALAVFLFLLLYFALVSYPYLSVKKAFVFGVKKAKVFVPGFLLVALVFFAANYVLTLFAQKLVIITAAVLVLLLAWARVYITQLAGE